MASIGSQVFISTLMADLLPYSERNHQLCSLSEHKCPVAHALIYVIVGGDCGRVVVLHSMLHNSCPSLCIYHIDTCNAYIQIAPYPLLDLSQTHAIIMYVSTKSYVYTLAYGSRNQVASPVHLV